MLKFKIRPKYRFISNESVVDFENLLYMNRKVTAAMAGAGDYFTILKLSETGSIVEILMANGKIITPITLGFGTSDVDVIVAYDEAYCFEEVEIIPVEEKKYDVMTAQIGGGQGFLVRHIGVSYEEAERWASEYVKEYDDQYAYIIQRFAKVELKMEPAVKIEKM